MMVFRRTFAALALTTFSMFVPIAGAEPKIGDHPLPALGRSLDGNPIDLDAMHGKVVVVTFWASWCGYCRKELPMLAHLQRVVGRDHLEVVAVNYRESRYDVLALIRANKDLDLTYVADPKGTVSDSYGVNGLPNLFIVDRAGNLAQHHVGYGEDVMQSIIQEMLSLLPEDVLKARAKAS